MKGRVRDRDREGTAPSAGRLLSLEGCGRASSSGSFGVAVTLVLWWRYRQRCSIHEPRCSQLHFPPCRKKTLALSSQIKDLSGTVSRKPHSLRSRIRMHEVNRRWLWVTAGYIATQGGFFYRLFFLFLQEMVDWFNAIRAARFHYLQVAFPGASDEEVRETDLQRFSKMSDDQWIISSL